MWTDFTISTAKPGLFRNSYMCCLLVESIPQLAQGPYLFLVWTAHMQGNVSFVYELRQYHLFLAIRKRWISRDYKLFINIFHEFDLCYHFSNDDETSKLMDNNWIVKWKNAFNSIRRFDKSMKGVTLESVSNFCPAFLHITST